MRFSDKVLNFSSRAKEIKDIPKTEEATKAALVMPFFDMLGYDVFNPLEFIPEFTADIGIKKGEKVDYAIVRDDKVSMIVEAKKINDNLDRHTGQLFRYFTTTDAKVAILTNGLVYKFYTDSNEVNKMDMEPFFVIDLLNLKRKDIDNLFKFNVDIFNIDEILNIKNNDTSILNIKSTPKYNIEHKTKAVNSEKLADYSFVNKFINETIDKDKTSRIESQILYKLMCEWCISSNIDYIPSKTMFTKHMKSMFGKHIVHRSNGKAYYRGIKLK